MEPLNIKGDDISPDIVLNHFDDVFSIIGESRPENPLKYYEPVFAWFNEYFNYFYVLNNLVDSDSVITKNLKIDLDYFNSNSAKVLFDLFILLVHTGRDKFRINFEIDWYYHADDTDMLDAGKEMEEFSGITFNCIAKD